MNPKDIHIGSYIRSKLDESMMSYNEFARRLCCQRHSLYYLFNQKTIDVEKLVRISSILDFDFLSLYSEPEKFENHSRSYTPDTPGNDKLAIIRLNPDQIEDFISNYPDAKLIELP